MWISRIKYELLQYELENAKKEKEEYIDKHSSAIDEKFDLMFKIKNLTYEIKALKSENSAFKELLSKKNKEEKE